MRSREGSSCPGCLTQGEDDVQHSAAQSTLGKVSCGNAKGLTEVSPLRSFQETGRSAHPTAISRV